MTEEITNWFLPLYLPIWNPINERQDILDIHKDSVRTPNLVESHTLFDLGITEPYLDKFYSFFHHYELTWTYKKKEDFNAKGVVNFISLDKVIQDSWDDTLGGNDWALDMKGFRPLDMFYDMDGFVGFYINRPEKNGLYLQHSDSSISPLHVNLDGYLQLLGMSKGFGWWQNALVQIHSGKEMPNVAQFKEKMPLIFPQFSWEAFVELYNKVRIDKK